jgi:hypothetical protein
VCCYWDYVGANLDRARELVVVALTPRSATDHCQALLELARDEVKKLTVDRDAAEKALSKQAILMQHHIADPNPMASAMGAVSRGPGGCHAPIPIVIAYRPTLCSFE